PPLRQLLGEALELLRPGETVGGALRRLGGRGREGGRGQRQAPPPAPPELLRLVAVADGLVARGVLGALEEHREGLERRMREETGGETGGEGEEMGGETGGEGKGSAPPQGGSGAVDMFAPGEEEEEEEEEKREGKEEGEWGGLLWEYTWEEGGDIYGPFSSAQMQEWASQGYFRGGGARCRRVLPLPHPPGPFYECARMDFELFT
uniref:GYF domain-containing protein n=1 Tax=Strigops habroptila TaxID=2489341 RepID=A0A672V2N2_STRHB